MAKAYWVATYRAIKDPAAMAAYANVSRPALEAAGGRVLVRGMPALTYELGVNGRVVLIEFDSVEEAKAVYESPPTKQHTSCSEMEPTATFELSRAKPED